MGDSLSYLDNLLSSPNTSFVSTSAVVKQLTPKQIKKKKSPPFVFFCLFRISGETWNAMTWDAKLLQTTGKYCSIPGISTGIFGRMESAPWLRLIT